MYELTPAGCSFFCLSGAETIDFLYFLVNFEKIFVYLQSDCAKEKMKTVNQKTIKQNDNK